MSKIFKCSKCKKRYKKNPRLKSEQKYCGSSSCQQARKNIWEKDKIAKDPVYRSKRKSDKTKWRKKRPCHEYQRQYRTTHPEYVKINREQQKLRNNNRNESVSGDQIVKTDTLISENLASRRFYALFPVDNESGKNIVKTDALIVQLANIDKDAAILLNKSP